MAKGKLKDFKVSYKVDLIPQKATMSCWYAGMQMLLRYHKIVTKESVLFDNFFTQAIIDYTTQGLNPTAVTSAAKAVGLRTSIFTPTPKLLAQKLQAHGPLWYGGMVPPSKYGGASLHVVVITGIEYSAALGDDYVLYNDPYPPGVGIQDDRDFKTFFTVDMIDVGTPFMHK